MAASKSIRKRPAVASLPVAKRARTAADDPANPPWYARFAGGSEGFYARYMDREWGVPIISRGRGKDRKLFEMLSLEGAQAGLSWSTILMKRDAYRRAFDGFEIATVAAYDARKIQALVRSPGDGADVIVKNRLKIQSVVNNARICLEVAKEHGSLCRFLWSFVGGRPRDNRRQRFEDIPAETEEARVMSKAMKKKGFTFVGPVVCYAFMQSVGMVNDHPVSTPQYRRVRAIVKKLGSGTLT
eukprot:gnl/TRDRNA2_/TRDRNA2_78239_c0_seq2.p1 gnl/TRDRNA2_/TRDRNA2_78239_c0~~gnl/TRDRNA2_/TRDRNA2_78239_c0_seq2.p1  ORF type:complete len:242 (+),score=47.15 gnl/TRDRNA2_/TRDRNA2_78239_c0_seq2:35-760(+)